MRRLALLVPVFALAGLLAGCGEDSASAQEVVAAAEATTVDTGTARITMAMALDGGVGGGTTVEMDGLLDFERNRSELEMDLADMGVEGTILLRAIGSELFLQSPVFQGAVAGVDGDTWLRVDVAAAAAEQGVDLGQLGGAGNGDPRQGLAVLRGVVDGGVEEVGDEEVRGAGTTRYRARVDLRKAAEEARPDGDPGAFDRMIDLLGQDSIRVEVWIDSDGVVRRVRMPMPLPEEAGGGQMTMTVEYHDFGVEADIAEPDPAEVRDLQEVVDQLGG